MALTTQPKRLTSYHYPNLCALASDGRLTPADVRFMHSLALFDAKREFMVEETRVAFLGEVERLCDDLIEANRITASLLTPA